jgi:hypothetical protein
MLVARAATPMATQIHNADWNPAFVPCATIVPAQVNPSDPPMPKAGLAIPGSDQGSSSGACMTPSAAIGVSDAAMTMPNTGMSSMTMFRLKAEMLQRHGWSMGNARNGSRS